MYLGIDYGQKRIGLALGEVLPKPFQVLENMKIKDSLKEITEICNEHEVDTIVIGLPMRGDGKDGALVPEIREFGTMLHEFSGRPVVYEEEQYSSVEVERLINLDDAMPARKRKKKREKLDAMAAAVILSQFIESRGK